MKVSPWLALAAHVLLAQPALAAVDNGGWEIQNTSEGITLGLYQESGLVDVTYLSLSVSTLGSGPTASRTLTGTNFTLDGGAIVYAVQLGDTLSNAAFNAGSFPVLVGPSLVNWSSLTVEGNEEFWLGAQTREGNAGQNPWTGLGWARARFDDNGQLTLLDSAMGYNVDTLVVGAVPEPGTWA
ncbi:MAG: hypothetical protein ACK4TS_05390 [Aquabacterium sp.]|jgi:hypothetical protein